MNSLSNKSIKSGFVVIRRTSPGGDGNFQMGMVTHNYMSPVEVKSKYKGIEGDLWPDESYKEQFSETEFTEISFDSAFNYYKLIRKNMRNDKIDLLFVKTGIHNDSELKGYKNFKFYGYDYGTFISRWNVYSIIINEVIYGRYEELRNASKFLNEYLLFDSLEPLFVLQRSRDCLVKAGEQVLKQLKMRMKFLNQLQYLVMKNE